MTSSVSSDILVVLYNIYEIYVKDKMGTFILQALTLTPSFHENEQNFLIMDKNLKFSIEII